MADPARARRLAKRIVTIVATELEHQVKDPRLAMVTITAARVTPDLHDATVFYTVYGDQTDADSTAAALASATGVLRSAVGRQTGVKFTPTLQFMPDTVPEHSRHIEELLVSVRQSDAALAERASRASYAGDADPYRKPREDGEPGEAVEDAGTDPGAQSEDGELDRS
jgi:ribosome-binding factor A